MYVCVRDILSLVCCNLRARDMVGDNMVIKACNSKFVAIVPNPSGTNEFIYFVQMLVKTIELICV